MAHPRRPAGEDPPNPIGEFSDSLFGGSDFDVSNDRRNAIRRELLDMPEEDIPGYIATLSSQGELQVVNEWLVLNGMDPSSNLSSGGGPDPIYDAPAANGPGAEISDDGSVISSPDGGYQPSGTLRGQRALGVLDLIRDALDSHPSNPNPTTPTSPPQSEGAPRGVAPAGTAYAYDESVTAGAEMMAGLLVATNQQGGRAISSDMRRAVSGLMPEGADAGDWWRAVESAGVAQADEQVIAAQTANGDAPIGLSESTYQRDTATPRWLLEANGELTEQQQGRLVDYWNDLNGTNYGSYRELVKSGALGTATDTAAPNDLVMRVVEASTMGSEPVEDLRIDLPGVRDPVYVSTADQEALRETYGLSTDGIVRLARLGNMQPRLDPRPGDTLGQRRPTDIFELAMVASVFGMQNGLADRRQREQNITRMQDQLAALKRDQADSPNAAPIESAITALQAKITSARRMNSETSGGGPNQPGVMGLYNNYQRGLDLYGQDQVLALLHTANPGLAIKVNSTGGDPNKMNDRDNAAAWDVLIKSGLVQRDSRTGLRPRSSVVDEFSDYFNQGGRGGGGRGGGGGGGSGPVRRLIDPEAVRQQVKGLWQGMFLADAPEDLIKAFTSSLQGALDKAPPGMEFDISARVQDWLKGQSVYGDLYKNKAAGTSEQDYQAQFMAASASMLGNETPDPEAVKMGMKSGEYQTTVGTAFASGAAKGNNSTLQERLARAANVVAANT